MGRRYCCGSRAIHRHGFKPHFIGYKPLILSITLASSYAAVLGATAVMSALYSRFKTGFGDAIEVPASAALMEGLAYNSMLVEGLPDRYKSPREREIEKGVQTTNRSILVTLSSRNFSTLSTGHTCARTGDRFMPSVHPIPDTQLPASKCLEYGMTFSLQVFRPTVLTWIWKSGLKRLTAPSFLTPVTSMGGNRVSKNEKRFPYPHCI